MMQKIKLAVSLTPAEIERIMNMYTSDPRATNQAGKVKRKRAVECFIRDNIEGDKKQ